MKKTRILVVEDESIVARDIRETMRNLGYDVPSVVSTGQAAIQKTEEEKPDLVLMDIVIKGQIDGIEAAEQIHSRFNIPVVYLTAYADDKTLDRAKITEPFGYIVKPFEDRDLLTSIEIALYKAKLEQNMKCAVKEWETTFDSISDMISIHDKDFKIVKVNKAFADPLGVRPQELVGKHCYEVMHGTNKPHPLCPFRVTLESKKQSHREFSEPRLGIYLQVSASPIFNDEGEVTGCAHVARDITEHKRGEKQIEASLKEKEMLLREIHHRVKNNIQVILSLLRLHSKTIEYKESIDVFAECQKRIKAMALIHEKFCQSKGSLNIDFKEYIKKLADDLIGSYSISGSRIALKMDVKEVSVEVGLATYCGLILNELISNSLKYAFPEGRSGEIKVSLRKIEKGRIELIVSDNGVGLPKDLDFRKTETLGLQLVNTLVKDQLGGEIELDRSAGTEFKITLPP